MADEFLLQRCVSNVVQNALQYTAPGGTILVTLATCAGHFTDGERNIRIEVKNTGMLTPKDREHLFDRLYRGDSSRKEGGTGLGLSIAKAIMDLHHGSILAENRDGYVCLSMEFPFQSAIIKKTGTT
jgi:two-component system sensor histidine kinase BaeS